MDLRTGSVFLFLYLIMDYRDFGIEERMVMRTYLSRTQDTYKWYLNHNLMMCSRNANKFPYGHSIEYYEQKAKLHYQEKMSLYKRVKFERIKAFSDGFILELTWL